MVQTPISKNSLEKQQKRIVGIDMTRAVAILMVTLTHAMTKYDTHGRLSGWTHYALEVTLQLATPIFLVIFGVMLELVYKPRYARGENARTTRRLLVRAAQCYGFYLLVIAALFLVNGEYSWRSLPMVSAFLISVPYSNLLAFYTIALALAPALLLVRLRYGLLPLIVLAALIHIGYPIVKLIPQGPELFGRAELQYLTGFLYGNGIDFYGPSILHGLSLVCIGMLFGRGLGERGAHAYRLVSGIAITSLICGLFLWDWSNPINSIQALSDMTLRVESHPLYFSVGILGTLAFVGLFILIYDRLKMQIGLSILVFGQHSLFAFGIGNVLIIIAPPDLGLMLGAWSATFCLFVTVCIVTVIFHSFNKVYNFERLKSKSLILLRLVVSV